MKIGKTSLLKKVLAAFACAFAFACAAFADYNAAGIPDSTEVRLQIVDSWLKAPLSELKGRQSQVFDCAGGPVQVRGERDGRSFAIIVTPQSFTKVSRIHGDSVEVVDEPSFSSKSCGAWVLYRDSATGKAERIVIRFTQNPEVYLQLYPYGNKTLADIIVYGSYVSRGVPLGIPFENLYTTSLQSIQSMSRRSLAWASVIPEAGQYEEIRAMIQAIRKRLPQVVYAEDAAYNENGDLYAISTGKPYNQQEIDESLNYYMKQDQSEEPDLYSITVGAPGFVKWIVDGIFRGYTGKNTRLSELIQPTVQEDALSKRGVMAQKWNLTLNLDWNRHLAEKAVSMRSVKGTYNFSTGGVDVTENSFVSVLTDDGRIVPALGYLKNIGYQAESLMAQFYILAINEPSWFYIGAIRHSSSSKPDESVFDGNAAFFPYFRSDGRFDCVVFQNGREITLAQFIKNNPGAYVHLERIKSSLIYDLQ
ncbi:MAG TPA: hypothetical protein DEO40_02690 [Treponema sp.]|jgi:hypothetical protein|nr:hypothetical protein [Treponema sp.]HCA19568.1 hypothetical protein [Treponema sp.]